MQEEAERQANRGDRVETNVEVSTASVIREGVVGINQVKAIVDDLGGGGGKKREESLGARLAGGSPGIIMQPQALMVAQPQRGLWRLLIGPLWAWLGSRGTRLLTQARVTGYAKSLPESVGLTASAGARPQRAKHHHVKVSLSRSKQAINIACSSRSPLEAHMVLVAQGVLAGASLSLHDQSLQITDISALVAVPTTQLPVSSLPDPAWPLALALFPLTLVPI